MSDGFVMILPFETCRVGVHYGLGQAWDRMKKRMVSPHRNGVSLDDA